MRDTSLKDYSASIVVQKDPYLRKMEKIWNSVSRGDDVAGHPDSGGPSSSSQRGTPIRHVTGSERRDTDLSSVEEQASIDNESDFDKVANALDIQHTRVHLRESRKRPKESGQDPHQLLEGGKHSGNGKSGTSACHTKFRLRRGLPTITVTRWNERILIKHTVTHLTLEVTAEKKF